MHKARLEALSDGVIAIIITIMVLEMKVPIHHNNIADLKEIYPVFLSYVLSFVYVGIYWNNHHHIMQTAHSINGGIMWANLHLLFWLSLVPFASGWMGENNFSQWPVLLYGIVLLMNAISYTILVVLLIKHHGKDSLLAQATGKDRKGKMSLVLYAVAIAFSFLLPWVSLALYVVVACIWFIPDKRIESRIDKSESQ